MLEKIGDSSRTMMEAMSDIVWSINPNNDHLDNIVIRMREYAAKVLEPKEITYTVCAEDADMNVKLPLEKRRDVFLVFKEAVNNLSKYSCANKAEINIRFHHNHIELFVKDNGRGFDTADRGGNGLKNMKQRAKNIGGKLEIISSETKGTTITLIVPIT